ncbi:MAG: hypothetical protein GX300_05530 [Tissierellia bacterium]|nr:hypothetical protein [Tissierellia bacterium]
MNNKLRSYFQIFLISIIFLFTSFLIAYYLDSMVLSFLGIIGLSLVLTLILMRFKDNKETEEIIKYISNINNLDFFIPQDVDLSEEARERINKVHKRIMDNFKTQIKISTDIYNICERLNYLATESLTSSETIASSVEIADTNTQKQCEMLNDTNDLVNTVFKSLENISEDVIDKILFISNSITSAQKGIEGIKDIEIKVKNSRDMLQNISNKIVELRNYSQEVVSLVDLINSISSQTQMLSLNAAIEAARAGEHGKGFSVVAMEVGKLASETENVSKKIEEVIYTLLEEINTISKSMGDEMNHMDSNYCVLSETNKDFEAIVETLNLGKESLEGIKTATNENNSMIEEIASNITTITEFSKGISENMLETTHQVMEQHNTSKELYSAMETISAHVYDMQQFVAGKVMEEKMLKQTYKVREFFMSQSNISDSMIKELLEDLGVDAIYITDSNGVVKYTNEKSAIGLNLYEADPTFGDFRNKKIEYLVTPIKQRVEDGKLFKFLTVSDESGKLYEVGMALESLIKDI